jgi:Zn-dependent peptidase ImmA (M78 family)
MIDLDYDEVEEQASRLRGTLGVLTGPISDIESVLTEAGVTVLVRPLGARGPDGMYVRRTKLAIALLNGNTFLPRFRFTGAHELGHHYYGSAGALDRDVYKPANLEEKRANALAACFLVPRSTLSRAANSREDIQPERALELANEFGVSYQTMVYRLHNCNLLKGGATKRDALLGARSAIFSDALRDRRDSRQAALPLDYVNRAVDAYGRQLVSLDRLAELLFVDEAQVKKLLTQAQLLHEEDQ